MIGDMRTFTCSHYIVDDNVDDTGIKTVPSRLSAVIASKPTVDVVPLIPPPYIPSTLHNEGFAVWVVNGVATPFTTASDTP